MTVNDDKQCNKLCFAVLNNNAHFFLKIHIKISFSISFTPIIDV